jgi:hypothetical protein
MSAHSDPFVKQALPVPTDGPPHCLASLRAEHAKLAQLAESVLEAIVAGDRTEAAAAIGLLQSSVLAHLDREETELIPAYARDEPLAASVVMADHAAIRRSLAALDVMTDLHLLRADALKEFLDALAAHAGRENRGLYRWSQGT